MSDDQKPTEQNSQGDGDTDPKPNAQKTQEPPVTSLTSGKEPEGGTTKLADSLEAKPNEGNDPPEGNAPEEYTDFEIPEGAQFHDEDIGSVKEFAKGLDLSQEKAQELTNFLAKLQDAELNRVAIARDQELKAWEQEIANDPELGGGNLQATMNAAKRAFALKGSPELAKAIEERGLDGHPAFVRLFKEIADDLGEDKLETGSSAASTKLLSDEQVFYPKG